MTKAFNLLIALCLFVPFIGSAQYAVTTLNGKTDGDSISIVELRRAKGILVRAMDNNSMYRVKSYTVKATRNTSQRGYREPVFEQERALFDSELMHFIVNRLQVGDVLYIRDVVAVDSAGVEAIVFDVKLHVRAEPVEIPAFIASNHLTSPRGLKPERREELFSNRSTLASLEELKKSSRLILWNIKGERPGYEIVHYELTIKRGVGKSNIRFVSDSADFSPKLRNFIKNHIENGDELRFDNIRVMVDSTKFLVPGIRITINAPFYAGDEDRNFISITGRLIDAETNDPIPNLSITVMVDNHDYPYKAKSNDQGGFVIEQLLQGTDYRFFIESTDAIPEGRAVTLINEEGFPVKSLIVGADDSVSDQDMDVMNQSYTLNKLNLDSLLNNKEDQMPFNLHLSFSSRDDELLRNSKEQVAKVVHFLKMNPEYKVEFTIYTDTRGNEMVNILVTEQRAYKVTNFMLKHGIPHDRIVASGGGESKVMNHCIEGVACTEKEHQVNRRVEFVLFKG